MAENTAIEWADDTVGFWWGCTEHGPECAHCYARDGYPVAVAESQAGQRLWASNRENGDPPAVRMKVESAHDTMYRLNRKAEKEGRRRIVFINSQADTFEDTNATIIRRLSPKVAAAKGHRFEIAYEFEGGIKWASPTANIVALRKWNLDDERREMFRTIDECPWLNCLLLTKRPENIRRMWPERWGMAPVFPGMPGPLGQPMRCVQPVPRRENVWLGTSAGTQETADRAIPELLKCRDLSPVLFVSCEPMLGPVDFTAIRDPDHFPYLICKDVLRGHEIHEDDDYQWLPMPKLDWVIVGGESGAHARPMHPQWARDVRDQCVAAGVPFFYKQTGEWMPAMETDSLPDSVVGDGRRGKMAHWWLANDGEHWTEGMSYPRSDERDRRDIELLVRVGKKAAGRLLDGREWNEFPEAASAHA
jgi:protein gp37